MDPFLPGEMPLLVLRHLAANQCREAAMKFIDEMPRLKEHAPVKPPSITDVAYLKHLLKTTHASVSLKDMLWDYRNSKMLVEEILHTDDDLNTSTSSETLLSQIQKIQEILRTTGEVSTVAGKSHSTKQTEECLETLYIAKVDSYTSTGDYECPKCLARRSNVEQKSDSGCQTEEFTAVQFGLQDDDDIPIIFYQTLLNDNNLQQKIAQTINEHMQDPQDERNDKFFKISSKAETEIDKFLVELLQDMPDDTVQSDSGLVQKLGGPVSVADIEKNLSSMFGEPDSVEAKSESSSGIVANNYTTNANSVDPSSHQVNLQKSGEKGQTIMLNTSLTTPSTSRDSESMDTSHEDNDEEFRSISDLITPPGSNVTLKRSQRHQSVKRITPTPLSCAHVHNPVFNTSVIVEKKTLDFGSKTAHMSVITTNIEPPGWRKLHRRPIDPRVPRSPKVTNNVTVFRKLSSDGVLRLGVDDASRCKNQADIHGNVGRRKVPTSSSFTNDKSGPSSAHKRKATPVKLTPEKAKNMEYNFMHFYHEARPICATKLSENACNSNEAPQENSAAKKTPLPCATSAPSQSDHPPSSGGRTLVLVGDNSLHEVTPMQPPPKVDESTLKTISPNALQRLIASANKVCTNTNKVSASFLNKKKSFSTPRKRKHVRNLSFATPPSLKAATPGSESLNTGMSLKRKATEELFSAELRSKKRLNWPDSEKKSSNVLANTTAARVVQRRLSDSIVSSSHSTPELLPSSDQLNQEHQHFAQAPDKANVMSGDNPYTIVPKESMPTILEESMSNISVSTDAPPPTLVISSDNIGDQQQPVYPSAIEPVGSLPSELTVYSVPTTLSDNTTKLDYYTIVDGALVPIRQIPMTNLTTISNGLSEQNLTNLSKESHFVLLPPQTPVKTSQQVACERSSANFKHAPANSTPESLKSNSNLLQLHQAHFPTQTNLNYHSGSSTSNKLAEISPPASENSSVNSNSLTNRQENDQTCRSSAVTVKINATTSISNGPNKLQKSKGRSKQFELSPQSVSSTEPSSSLTTKVETKVYPDKPKRSSRSKAKEKKSDEEEYATKDNVVVHSKSSGSRTRGSHTAVLEKTPDDPEKLFKKGRSKGNQNEKAKKPKIMLPKPKPTAKSLFGESPTKKRTGKSKVPLDVIAAQAVASQAIAPKSPRRSPRKLQLRMDDTAKAPFTVVSHSNVPSQINEKPDKRVINEPHTQHSTTEKSLPKNQESFPTHSPVQTTKHSLNKTPLHADQNPLKQSSEQSSPTIEQNILQSTVKQSHFAEQALLKQATEQSPPTQTQRQVTEQHQENVEFNIVPAPLGFPDPTPIKNFAETGCLNISDITCDINGPLITPFKSVPPSVGLNETHFTLPPTPRVMLEDNDSNSNSAQSMRLIFDGGLYPANLLTSTPLKPGIPRTPGRESSSSNSQSPIMPGKSSGVIKSTAKTQQLQHKKALVRTDDAGTQVSQHQLQEQFSAPSTQTLSQTISHSRPITATSVPASVITSVITKTGNVSKAAILSTSKGSRSFDHKSDGEISSSDDEDGKKSKNKVINSMVPPKLSLVQNGRPTVSQPSILKTQSQVSSSSTGTSHQQQSHHFRSPQLHSRPPATETHNPNIKKPFKVGDRAKFLTFSEQETLYSLMSMRSFGKTDEIRRNDLSRPTVTESSLPQATIPRRLNDNEVPVRGFSTGNTRLGLGRLIKATRKVTQSQAASKDN